MEVDNYTHLDYKKEYFEEYGPEFYFNCRDYLKENHIQDFWLLERAESKCIKFSYYEELNKYMIMTRGIDNEELIKEYLIDCGYQL